MFAKSLLPGHSTVLFDSTSHPTCFKCNGLNFRLESGHILKLYLNHHAQSNHLFSHLLAAKDQQNNKLALTFHAKCYYFRCQKYILDTAQHSSGANPPGSTAGQAKHPLLNSALSQIAFKVACMPFNTEIEA